MEAITLLLVFSLSGLSNTLNPRLVPTEAAQPKEDRTALRNKQLKYVSIAKENKTENTDAEYVRRRKAEREEGSEGVTPNPVTSEKTEEDRGEGVQLTSQRGSKQQTRAKPEREKRKRKRVAGINRRERRRCAHKGKKSDISKGNKLKKAAKGKEIKTNQHEELLERQRRNHTAVNHTLPSSTTSAKVGQDSAIPAIFQIITQPQDPPPPPPPPPHNGPFSPSTTPAPPVSSHLPTLHTQVRFQLFPPSVNTPTPTSSIHTSSLKRGDPQRPKGAKVKAGGGNTSLKPAREELQTQTAEGTKEISGGANAFMPRVTTPQPEEDELTDLIRKELHILLKLHKSTSTKLSKPTPKLNTTQPRPKNHTTAKAASGGKNRTTKKENEGNSSNRTQLTAAVKKEARAPVSLPFTADYCPPVCVCSGSVVQCSDKNVEKVPYGIPLNARSILLMNNYIRSIPLDSFPDYVSLEMLVLSNNWLTDGAVKGAFGLIPALKRLYLDGNRLKSVPMDLPVSLEELRLDNNHLKAVSEAAWSQCPGLFVLRLSSNHLGPESLPPGVLQSLRNLHTLSLDHNQLTSIPLGLPLFLKELYLKGNLIEKLHEGAFFGMSVLEVLDLSTNRLTNAGLKNSLNVTSLESLNLEGNRLEHVPRHLPPSLTSLNLEGNRIASVKKADFSRVRKLELLGLARNKLFEVAPGAFRELPSLHRLDLCHNSLHQVPRQLPRGLRSVALSHNEIQSVPHDAFCWGNKSLSLRGFVQLHLDDNVIDVGKMDARTFRCLKGFELVHSD